MRTGIRMGTFVEIDDDCPIEFSINGDGDVELLMGSRTDSFEMIYTPHALERFLALGTAALAQAEQPTDEAVA